MVRESRRPLGREGVASSSRLSSSLIRGWEERKEEAKKLEEKKKLQDERERLEKEKRGANLAHAQKEADDERRWQEKDKVQSTPNACFDVGPSPV